MKPMTEIVTQYYTLFVLLLLLDGIVVKKKKSQFCRGPGIPSWTHGGLLDPTFKTFQNHQPYDISWSKVHPDIIVTAHDSSSHLFC